MTKNSFKDANRRYVRVFVPVIAFYCIVCSAGPFLLLLMNNPPKLILALVAVVTSAPIAVVFWLMGRYLKEVDDYTRKIQIDAMLIGGGITFSVAVI